MRQKTLEETMRQAQSQFQYYNLKFHMVLYSNGKLFEYNPIDCEVKPFNCFVWYPIHQESYDALLQYLMDIFDAIDSKALSESMIQEEYEYLGTFDGNTLIIDLKNIKSLFENCFDLEKIAKENGFTDDESNTLYEEARYIVEECDELAESLEKLYDEWSDANRFIFSDYGNVNELMRHEIL